MSRHKDLQLHELCLKFFKKIFIEKVEKTLYTREEFEPFSNYRPPFIVSIRGLKELEDLIMYFFENSELYVNILSLLVKHFNNIFKFEICLSAESNFESLINLLSSLNEGERLKRLLKMNKYERNLILEIFIEHLINEFLDECRWRILEYEDYDKAFEEAYKEFEALIYNEKLKVKVERYFYGPFFKDLKRIVFTSNIRFEFDPDSTPPVTITHIILDKIVKDYSRECDEVIDLLTYACMLLKPGVAFFDVERNPHIDVEMTYKPMILTREDIPKFRRIFDKLLKLYKTGKLLRIKSSLDNFKKSIFAINEEEAYLSLIRSLERLLFYETERVNSDKFAKSITAKLIKIKPEILILKGISTKEEVERVMMIVYRIRSRFVHGRRYINDLLKGIEKYNFKSFNNLIKWLENITRFLINNIIEELIKE